MYSNYGETQHGTTKLHTASTSNVQTQQAYSGGGSRGKPTHMRSTPRHPPSPEAPEHAASARNGVGGAAQQEPDALLDRVAHGPHRRRVPHVRTRLWERVGIQARLLEVPLVDGRLVCAVGRRMRGHRLLLLLLLERAARCA